MTDRFVRRFTVIATLILVSAGGASAQDCSGTITADEAM